MEPLLCGTYWYFYLLCPPAKRQASTRRRTSIDRDGGNINLITFLRARKLIICSAGALTLLHLLAVVVIWMGWCCWGYDDEHFPQFNFMSFQSTSEDNWEYVNKWETVCKVLYLETTSLPKSCQSISFTSSPSKFTTMQEDAILINDLKMSSSSHRSLSHCRNPSLRHQTFLGTYAVTGEVLCVFRFT